MAARSQARSVGLTPNEKQLVGLEGKASRTLKTGALIDLM